VNFNLSTYFLNFINMSNCSHYTLPVALPSVLFTVVYIPRHPAHIHRFTTDNWRFFLHTYQSRKSLIFKLISSLASSSNPVYSTTSKRYAPMHTPKPFSRIQIFAYDLWKLRPPAYPCPHLALISYTKIRLPITTGKPTNPSPPPYFKPSQPVCRSIILYSFGDKAIALGVHCIDGLFFKINWDVLALELPDVLQAVEGVSGKSADGLCDNCSGQAFL